VFHRFVVAVTATAYRWTGRLRESMATTRVNPLDSAPRGRYDRGTYLGSSAMPLTMS
jgi:hypothetical protein